MIRARMKGTECTAAATETSVVPGNYSLFGPVEMISHGFTWVN
jgi:hypothetical protein